MMELKTQSEQLLNDSPVEEANRYFTKNHFEALIGEEIAEVSDGVLHTNKDHHTLKMVDAAINGIKGTLGKWASSRNDFLHKVELLKTRNKNSEQHVKHQKLVDEREDQKVKAKEQFMRDNHYMDKKLEHDQTRLRYETMFTELGGKPPVRKKIAVYLFSILFIGAIEWFINFSTFNIKYPAGIAFGATILVAMSIAIASHLHGALLKQRVALFAPHRKQADKRQVVLVQSIFTLLLFLSLLVVTWNRYDLLVEQMSNAGGGLPSLPGEDSGESSVMGELWPFVIMNILVWIVGVAISYFTHDPRPDYQESRRDYDLAKASFHKVDKRLQEEMERIDAEYEVKLGQLKNALSQFEQEVKDIDALVARIQSKEKSIVQEATRVINEAIERYQSMLTTTAKQKGLSDIKIGPEQKTLDEYHALTLTVSNDYVAELLK